MSYICLWLVTLHMTRSMHCFITNEKDFCNSETNNSSSDDFSVLKDDSRKLWMLKTGSPN